MNAKRLKELEEAIRFGRKIESLNAILGHTEAVLGSTVWSDDMKRETATNLSMQRNLAQELVSQADVKYKRIKAAEEAMAYALYRMAEIEKKHSYISQ